MTTLTSTIAQTILHQLGGRKFTTMTGAKQLTGHADALSFKLPSRFASHGINYCKITLTTFDDYTMEFGKVYGRKYSVIETRDTVYCDQLQAVFTDVTGLDTHM